MKYLIILCMLLSLVGCSSDKEEEIDFSQFVDKNPQVSEDPLPTTTPHVPSNPVGEYFTPEEVDNDYSSLKDIEVDNDISEANATIAYALVSNIMYEPLKYEGNTIKMVGTYTEHMIPPNNSIMKGIMLLDATQCCVGYLELLLPDSYDIEDGEEIMIIGNVLVDKSINVSKIEVTELVH